MDGDKGRARLRRGLITSYLIRAEGRKCRITHWLQHYRPKLIIDKSVTWLIYSQYSPAITTTIYTVRHNTHSKIREIHQPVHHCQLNFLIIAETTTFEGLRNRVHRVHWNWKSHSVFQSHLVYWASQLRSILLKLMFYKHQFQEKPKQVSQHIPFMYSPTYSTHLTVI